MSRGGITRHCALETWQSGDVSVSLLEECFGVDPGLAWYGAERAFRDIAGMVV
jgi:hypothetical protein